MDRWTDVESEYKLVAYLLTHPDAWRALQADVDPAVFSDAAVREIASAMRQVSEGGKPLSVEAVARIARQKVDVDLGGLADLASAVFSVDDAKFLLDGLRAHAQRRRVLASLKGAVTAIDRADDDTAPEEILAKAQRAMLDVFQRQGRKPVREWADVLAELHAEWLAAQEGRIELAYPAGLMQLTSTLGGLRPKRMYVLAARTSMGKSAFAMHIVRTFAQRHNKRALVFTLEQSALEIAQRSVSAALGIDADLWHRSPWQNADKERLEGGLGGIMEWPLAIAEDQRLTVGEIAMRARAEKAEHPGLSLLVVDHMQEIRIDAPRGTNGATAIGEAASELRALAQELDVPLILVAQLNRSLESRQNKRPMPSDLRDSGRLEEIADTVLFLYREAYYRTMDDPALDNMTEIIVGKNRQGGGVGKTVLATFDAAHMTFADAPAQLKARYGSIIARRVGDEK